MDHPYKGLLAHLRAKYPNPQNHIRIRPSLRLFHPTIKYADINIKLTDTHLTLELHIGDHFILWSHEFANPQMLENIHHQLDLILIENKLPNTYADEYSGRIGELEIDKLLNAPEPVSLYTLT